MPIENEIDQEDAQAEPMGLEDRIIDLLETEEPTRESRFFERVEKLEEEHGEIVYAAALHALTRLQFAPEEAREHWGRIRDHLAAFNRALGRETNFRVALMDYFVEIHRRLHNPILLEIRIFRRAEERALIDELTGLNNYRAFKLHLHREVRRARRYRSPLSLIIFDVDDFKRYNDRNGHARGNEALSRVAAVLRENSRETDLVCRYGGEEFTIILPETDREGAMMVAERIRVCLDRSSIFGEASQPGGKLTLSGGVATYGVGSEGEEDLVASADKALYMAKGAGKNRIEVFDRERRVHARVAAEFTGKYWVMSAEDRCFVTRNASEGGLLFSTEEAPAVGATLKLQIAVPGQDKPMVCAARVVRVEERRPNGGYEVGVAFFGIEGKDRRRLADLLSAAANDPKK